MPVVAIVGNKGGAGKTTLSINIASAQARNSDVVLVDADPQGSSSQWRVFASSEDAIPVFEAQEQLHDQINDLQADYDNVFIDCPPSVHAPETSTVLKFADMVVIPVQPSPMDLWATTHIEKALEQARPDNPSIRALLVINQMELRTTLSRLVREALTQIELPVADTAVRRRAIYRYCILEGKSVFEMGHLGVEASKEIQQLTEEIMNHAK